MPDLPPAATTLMCACSHHWSVHRESGQTAPGAACWGYIGSTTPGPLREPCDCAGFEPWSGPRDARTGEPVRPLTLATDSRVTGVPQAATDAARDAARPWAASIAEDAVTGLASGANGSRLAEIIGAGVAHVAVAVLEAAAPAIAAGKDTTITNLRNALKEAGAEMDRRYEMGAAAERERIRQLAERHGASYLGDMRQCACKPGCTLMAKDKLPFAGLIESAP